jgi:hypothetical protein
VGDVPQRRGGDGGEGAGGIAERPRLLLVPAFTELQWTIRPQLEEWAEVASYDPPGVGSEPLPEGLSLEGPSGFSDWRRATAERGLEEVDRRGWTRFFVAVDGEGIAAAVKLVESRPDAVQGFALGHAALSRTTEGERPVINKEVWSAMVTLIKTDRQAFIRHGIAQVTAESVSEETAGQMLRRFPDNDFITRVWIALGTEPEPVGEELEAMRMPLLLGQHVGCLGWTEESFQDIVARFPQAATVACPEACSASPTFGDALRGFCGAAA